MPKTLIAVLGIGKGTWGHVARLIAEEEWKSIILVSNEWVQENFKPAKECIWLLINPRAGFEVIKSDILAKLPEEEMAVSIISGSGKEHVALLTALKEKKSKYSLVIITGDGTKYF